MHARTHVYTHMDTHTHTHTHARYYTYVPLCMGRQSGKKGYKSDMVVTRLQL